MTFNNIFKEGTRYKALFLSLLLCPIGSGLHKGILDNYVAEMAHMNELDRGIMEFFREVLGLLLVLILAIFCRSSAEKMYKLSMVFMAAGMVMQSLIDPVKALVILAIFECLCTGSLRESGGDASYDFYWHFGQSPDHHLYCPAGWMGMEHAGHRYSLHRLCRPGSLQQCLRCNDQGQDSLSMTEIRSGRLRRRPVR